MRDVIYERSVRNLRFLDLSNVKSNILFSLKYLSTEYSSSNGSILGNQEVHPEHPTPEVEDPKVPQIEKSLLSDAEAEGKQTIDKTKLKNTVNTHRRDPKTYQTSKYSEDLKSGHVRISNGQSLSGFCMVKILNGSYLA